MAGPHDEGSGDFARLLRTGGALRGRLWSELSAELAARAATETAAEEAPLRIGAYQLLGRLGSGGMGEVFLAHDGRLDRRVAIKRILAAQQPNPRARERLRREAAAVAKLNHPAIVQVYDILEEPGGEAIVMEFAEGYTLAQTLALGPLPGPKAIGIARQVAEGLTAAHAVGLVHRDLKTENVIVTPSGQAKILDFGIAKRLAPDTDLGLLTAEGALVGTSRAMSPEQAQGLALDARSDLFSFGVMLYEVCTGCSPFLGDSRSETLRRVIAEPPQAIGWLNPHLPPPLVDLVDALLAKDPARRPSGAAEVVGRLAEIERGPDLGQIELPFALARLPGPASDQKEARLVEPARQRRLVGFGTAWPWVAVVVAVLALTGALAFDRHRRAAVARTPLAVLVEEPKVGSSSPDERTRFAAFAVREAILASLVDLQGIEVIGQRELAASGIPARDACRSAAADEAVASSLVCEGLWCRVSVLRRHCRDARVMGGSGSFDVTSAPEDSLALANAVAVHVRRVFSEHAPRSTRGRLEVRSADYEQYLALRRRTEAGDLLGRPELAQLEEIVRSSPGLTEAFLLAADAARLLPDHARADRILRDAEARHPGDPGLVHSNFQLKLESGQLAAAETALAELERLAPGHVRVLQARARLLSHRGRLAEVAEVRRRLVRERPSWKNLLLLTEVEIELADPDAAREHLAQLLNLSPGNARGLERLAELEWELGDPARAARIYEDLLNRNVDRLYLTNLGWSLLLAQDYAGSVAANQRALVLNADHALSRLNLGIAREGAGDVEAARRDYRELLRLLTGREGTTGLKGPEPLLKAQVLARLGDCVPAVDVTTRALLDSDHSRQTSFRAAIVHALCGERNHALVHARAARGRGLSRWWFGVPGFQSLRGTPEFVELLAETQGRPNAS